MRYAGLMLFGISMAASGQPATAMLDAYRRAEAFLPQNVGRLVEGLAVRPAWSDDSSFFWYREEQPNGWRFVRVGVPGGERSDLFDHERAAREFARSTGGPVDVRRLPLEGVRAVESGAIVARAFAKQWRIDEQGSVTEVPPTHADTPSLSPDGKWEASLRGGNLLLRDTASGEVRALTSDGTREAFYARALPNPATVRNGGELFGDGPADVVWSADSMRLATYRIDTKGAGTLTLIQSKPEAGYRPSAITYHYPLTGDEVVPVATAHVFEVPGGRRVDLDVPPLPILYYYGMHFEWRADNRHLLTQLANRGWNALRVLEADAHTGSVREVVAERSETFIPHHRDKWTLIEEWQALLWVQELQGRPHLQLFDAASARKLRQLTRGDWSVLSVPRVAAETDSVFFVATGRERGRDPYLRHLYRIGRSGGEPRLLTPEPADHEVYVSPDGRWFIDNISRADLPTRTVLRDARDGAIVSEVSKARLAALEDRGFAMPEIFEVTAADGRTPLHGVLYRPADLDERRKYPVIDNMYTGPHYVMAPKSFDAALRGRTANAIAQLGFVVVLIDGRGTSGRSRAFLDAARERLGSVGLDDHEAALRQLAMRHPYLDLDRVGAYGFSAGGFDAARALFRKPALYKVAVAASGNHDHRSDKASWNEMWMGLPLAAHYDRESNLTWARHLRGKLLLAHGELDENVHPMATLQLAGALIEENKDFELLIVPNAGHFLDDSPYYLRRQWDFFVRHLKGAEPPAGYAIAPFSQEE